jgi:hypothetical protein
MLFVTPQGRSRPVFMTQAASLPASLACRGPIPFHGACSGSLYQGLGAIAMLDVGALLASHIDVTVALWIQISTLRTLHMTFRS